jgi:hypothetical protein
MSLDGRLDNESPWAGTVAIVAIVAIANHAGGVISLPVDSLKYRVLPTTAATLTI